MTVIVNLSNDNNNTQWEREGTGFRSTGEIVKNDIKMDVIT